MAVNDTTFTDAMGEADDWIELHNAGDTEVVLEGYGLSDSVATLGDYVFPADLTLAPGERIIVWADRDTEQGPLHADFKLSGDGEEVILSKDGEVVDAMAFGPQCPDVAFGRPTPDATPTYLATATPGEPNSAARDEAPSCPEQPPTDGGTNTAAENVFINELAPAGTDLVDSEGEHEPWVELFNASGEEQDLTDHFLTDDPDLPMKWRFVPGQRIDAGGTLLIFLDGEPQEGLDHAGFALSATADVIQLRGPAEEPLDGATVPDAPFGVSWGRSSDGTDDWVEQASPSPDAPNVGPATDDGGVIDADAGAPADAGDHNDGGAPSDAGTDGGPPQDDAGTDAGADAGLTDGGA